MDLNFESIGLNMINQPPSKRRPNFAVPTGIENLWFFVQFSTTRVNQVSLIIKSIHQQIIVFSTVSEAPEVTVCLCSETGKNMFLSLASKTNGFKSLNYRAPERSYWTTNLTHKRFVIKERIWEKKAYFGLSD